MAKAMTVTEIGTVTVIANWYDSKFPISYVSGCLVSELTFPLLTICMQLSLHKNMDICNIINYVSVNKFYSISYT